MSQPNTETPPETGGAPAPEVEGEAVKPTDTVEYWKSRSRSNEAQAKANATAAKELAEIRESQKSDAQKVADRLAAAETAASEARAESLRLRVAAKHGISDDDADLFLTGADEATLTRQAERLAGRTAETKSKHRVPSEGRTPSPDTSSEREVVRGLFG